MRNWLVIYKKEIQSYLHSPIAYVTSAFFLFLGGYFFFIVFSHYTMYSMQALNQRGRMGQNLNPTEMILRPLFMNLSVISIFVVPLLTMRLLSEEKRTGSAEVLFTHPVKDSEILLGKFLACYTLFAANTLVTMLYPLIVALNGSLEWGAAVSILTGFLLMGLAFVGFGLFVSSLTEHQIVAGVAGLGGLLFFWLVGWAADSMRGGILPKVLEQLSLFSHTENFMKGVMDSHDALYLVLFTCFCFYLTLQALESKKWRG